MTQTEQTKSAKAFAEYWQDKGDEKQETQRFWIELLQTVLGVENPAQFIEFEKRVQLTHTSFIDGYIPTTKVLIEQKGSKIDLHKGYEQSDGSILTPYQQAKRYADEMPNSIRPDWIIVCNFTEFLIYNMETPHAEPVQILLKDLEKEYYRLSFIADTGSIHLKQEMEVSVEAGRIVGKIYDALLKQYKNPESEKTLKSLNMLCVRLVFCLYAEDAGIFNSKSQFHDYMESFRTENMRQALLQLFKVLDTKVEDRDEELEDKLSAFPYVNGGLFTEEDTSIPSFSEELRNLVLSNASEDFDWSRISPTIFGAVFESTLNPDTRRSGGMHYTSIENIHKVIDPLFMDELTTEFNEIKSVKSAKTRNEKLLDFQKKLGNLTFLDPACGSGNFLTETYLSLRRLENECIKLRLGGQQNALDVFGDEFAIQVSIHQFYGIEINDFAAVVAKTALWIAESQMMNETAMILSRNLDFLPLKTYANIVEGNALRLDWKEVVPVEKLNYIMGNPPFVGNNQMNAEQRKDIAPFFPNNKTIDYVAAWYVKAADLIQNTNIKCAFVSTNSICQGEQVPILWKPLFENKNIKFDFAYRTFRWDSESNLKAHVHCVIVGFSEQSSCHSERSEESTSKRDVSATPQHDKKIIFDESGTASGVKNINPYLIDAPNIFVESRSRPLCDVPAIRKGNQPTDGGNLIIEADEIDDFLKKEPNAKKYIKKLVGAQEYINNQARYCLWLVGVSPAELRKMPLVMERIAKVREMRLASSDAGTRRHADTPMLFREQNNPETFIIVPSVSSEKRRYIPMGFMTGDTIPTNLVLIIPDATLYHFGVLTSNVHMAWMRVVCGRLKSDYRYSKDIVYNNFPWPTPTDEQKAKIEQTAQVILDARAKFPDASLADLYDEITMPPELRKAHQENDKAVMKAYGFSFSMTASECVGELFKMYESLARQ